MIIVSLTKLIMTLIVLCLQAELDAKEAMVEHYREDYSELQLQIRENVKQLNELILV